FALEPYIKLFQSSIDKSSEQNPMTCGVDERVEVLNDFHTLAVYRFASRALFERHKLLLSLHITTRILASKSALSPNEFAFFLRGGQTLDKSTQAVNPSPDWITPVCWDNITSLAVASPDAFKGFQSAVEQGLREWKRWYMASEPESESLPGEWESRLDPLQKLLLVRALRGDRILPAVGRFVTAKMGPRFVEPPNFDLEAIYDESDARIPLVFVLSPGMDPTPLLRGLAVSRGTEWKTISLGQGQAPKAEAMLRHGVAAGFWVFLANCHLSVSWLPALEKLVVHELEEKTPHATFRLWLSSDPTPKFPIALLQKCMKMTTEPPRGLKANMARLLINLSEDQFTRCTQANEYRKLLFSLVWFHAILLERKKFKNLGWNVAYDFNDSDFDICENILAMYLDEYPNEIP
ncbi:hypothetical protein FOZ63_008574, partial [Perkinsus olseni]